MFKPLARSSKTSHRSNGGFAETMFVHTAGDDDYSGFAPTECHEEDEFVPLSASASPEAVRMAASTSRSALERAAFAPVPGTPARSLEEPAVAESWVTSQWVAAQEAKAHEAAHQARAVIAAQRRADAQAEAARHHHSALAAHKSTLARLRAAFERLLPGEFRSLLPLCIGVTVTMALISAVLPLVDKH